MPDISHSRQLRRKIQLAGARLNAVALALWDHPRLADLYPEFLFQNHSIIRSTVPLMKAAREQTLAKFGSDPVAPGLVEYFSKHIPEETNHDLWVLEDMEVLGFDRSEVLRRMPSATAGSLVGLQYYWIYHFHPVALLGYIAVMEGTPPQVEHVEDYVSRTGFPRTAFRNLFNHAKLDPDHRDDLNRVLDQLPLTAEHASLIGVNAFNTIHLLSRVLEETLESSDASI